MKAIVMAGGEGTRLRPLTCSVPKPMVPLLNKPMLEYTVEHLLGHGISDMAFTLMYLPSVITDYFQENKTANIDFFIEEIPLGTAGSVKNASLFVDGTFLIISGDALTDIDITKAAEFHKSRGAKVTIVLKKMGKPLEYGVIITDENGKVERFVEKPGWEDVFSDTVNTGIYIVEQDVLDLIPSGQKFDFAKDLFPLMMKKGLPIFGYTADGYWCDVGNIESYIKAHEELLKGNVKANIKGKLVDGIYVGENVYISSCALLQSPSFIADGAIIGDGVKIGNYCSIGRGAQIGRGSNIKRSILHENVSIGKNTKLSSCVVASGCRIGERCSVYEGAVIGERCCLPSENTVYPHVKLWPEKWLSSGTSASENIILGYGEKSDFIANNGFRAKLGSDITPLRLGKVFGAVAELMSGRSIAISSDDTEFSNAVQTQAIGIFTMSGCNVYTMHGVTWPVCAHVAGMMNADLGIAVKCQKQTEISVQMFEPDLFMLSKATLKKLQAKYFAQGEQLPSKVCGSQSIIGAANELYINTLHEKIDRSIISSYETSVLVTGNRQIDDFAAKVFRECEINVLRQQDALLHNEAAFEVKVSKNGEFCTLILPNGRTLNKSDFETLVYYLIFITTESNEVTLPSCAPRNVVAMAELMGLNYTYASKQKALQSISFDKRRMLFDGIFAVCKLCEHLSKVEISIDDIATMIEPQHLRVREIGCDWQDMGRVIKSVYSQGNAHADEGLRLDVDDGYGYICPHSSLPKIVIRTEGFSQEFANELCDKYSTMVKKIIKNKK